MIISFIAQQPLLLVVWLAVILIALTVHEFAHAWMASARGDKTAEHMGRLTLNPLAHVDWIGMLMLITFGFGWAKPVPFNPYNLKDPRRDGLWIALAGPFANLVIALLSASILRILLVIGALQQMSLLFVFLLLLIIVNLFLMIFNLIPIYPLDGSKLLDVLFADPKYAKLKMQIMALGPRLLLILILVSIFTPFNIFSVISTPSFAICSAAVGQNCAMLLSSIF